MWAQYWENIMYQHPAYLKSQHSKIWNYEMEIELQMEFHDKKSYFMSFASAYLVTQFHDYLIGAFSVIVKIQTCEGSFAALVVGWRLNAKRRG